MACTNYILTGYRNVYFFQLLALLVSSTTTVQQQTDTYMTGELHNFSECHEHFNHNVISTHLK